MAPDQHYNTGNGLTRVEEPSEVFHVEGPGGFTQSFDARTVDLLVRMGLIRHQRDGHVLEDGSGNGVGPVVHFYGP